MIKKHAKVESDRKPKGRVARGGMPSGSCHKEEGL